MKIISRKTLKMALFKSSLGYVLRLCLRVFIVCFIMVCFTSDHQILAVYLRLDFAPYFIVSLRKVIVTKQDCDVCVILPLVLNKQLK